MIIILAVLLGANIGSIDIDKIEYSDKYEPIGNDCRYNFVSSIWIQ
jgi:hypothetical protein